MALVLRIYVRGQGCGAFPSFFFYFLFLFLFSFLDVRRSCIFVLYVITHGAGKATQISYLISAAECWVSFFVQPRSELQLEHYRSLAMKYAQRPYPCLMAACVYVVAASNGTMTPPPKRNAPLVPQTPNASAASWRRTISPASTSHQPPSTVHMTTPAPVHPFSLPHSCRIPEVGWQHPRHWSQSEPVFLDKMAQFKLGLVQSVSDVDPCS